MAMSKKKKKKMVGLILLIVFMVILFAAYAFLAGKNKGDEEETTASEVLDLFDIQNVDVIKVLYTVDGQTLGFFRETSDDDWYYLSDSAIPVDQSKVSAIVTTACAINVEKEIGDTSDNLDDFGLSEPSVVLELTDKDGNVYTLYIGSKTGGSSSCNYAYLKGESRIISISNSILSKLDTDISSFFKAGSYPSVDENEITRIFYEDDSCTIELFNDPAELTEAEAIGTTTWYYLEDGVYMPVNQSNCTKIIDTVTGIVFESCVTTNADNDALDSFGLSEPLARLTVDYTTSESVTEETDTTNDSGSYYATSTVTSDESFTLLIGNKCVNESGNDGEKDYYYAALEGSTEVFRVSSEDVEFFTGTNLNDYIINLYPTLCNFNGIREISAEYNGKKMDLQVSQETVISEDGEESVNVSARLNGKECEESEARSIFASLIRLTADHILADDEIISGGDIVFSCTYYTNYEKKPEITFEITKHDDVYYQLSLNGKAKYAITKQEFNTLIDNVSSNFE